MNPIRIAVIGAGHLGRIHVRLVENNPNFELVAIVDPDPSSRQQVVEQLGGSSSNIQITGSHFDVVEAIDAAIIATPTESHHEIASELMLRGIHVFVEKPLTLNSVQADSLVDLAEEHGVILQVGHVERFNAAWQSIRNQVGEIRYLEAQRTSGFTFRSVDVGAVFDLMIHDIDLALSSIDSQITSIRASGMSVLGRNEDMAQARLEFANGAVANLTASRCSFEPQRTIQIIGSHGFAMADLTTASAKVVQPPMEMLSRELDVYQWPRENQMALKDTLFKDWMPVQELEISPVNAIEEEHNDFAQSINSDGQPAVCGRAATLAVEIAERVVEQINTHHWTINDQTLQGPLCTWTSRLPAARAA